MTNPQIISLRNTGLTPDEVIAVARNGAHLELDESARTAIAASEAVIDRILANDEVVYGVTTGFGSLADTRIPPERSAELQVALIRSHAAGMGAPIEEECVRAMMALRARSLAMGYSGVRPIVVETILSVLNAGLVPAVPEHGSLGASGDLAPLAHAALCLLGEGEFLDGNNQTIPARPALEAAGIKPLKLRAKEGLALINGTDGMLGMLVMSIDDLANLAKLSDIAAAMTIEGLMGTDRVFAADLQTLRPQLGQATSAANLRSLLHGSGIGASHRTNDTRVQDAYSLRCTPAVHGALRDVLGHARLIADRELASAIDNPMILPDGRVESCGNFHGAPLAQTADFLAIAVADLSALSERRTDRMLDRTRSHGLTPFVAADAGVDSGMMIAHYTQAAMTTQNRRLAAPASADTLPTSAMQEDHVSLGWAATRKLRTALDNLANILAIEITCAARAIDMREHPPAPATGAVLARIREDVPGVAGDRWVAPELARMRSLVTSRTLVDTAEQTIGELS